MRHRVRAPLSRLLAVTKLAWPLIAAVVVIVVLGIVVEQLGVLVLAAASLVWLALIAMSALVKRGEDAEDRKELAVRMAAKTARPQVSLVPTDFEVPGLEIAAAMRPSQQVGGACFDVQPANDGCWLTIGDVAGHGVSSGLIALLAQNSLQAITLTKPDVTPSEAIALLSAALFENLRSRMKQDEHITFVLLRCYDDGRVVFAGAHEDLVIYRADTGRCEIIGTRSVWLDEVKDLRDHVHQGSFQLAMNDVLILYSDGVLEAANACDGEQGTERLFSAVEGSAPRGPEAIVTTLIEQASTWSPIQRDDLSALVVRRLPSLAR